MIHPVFPVGQIVQPIDILSGLGAADRPLLSACIALFEDSTLARRLSQLYGQVKGSAPAWLRQVWEVREIENVAASVQSRVDFWDSGDWSDDDLRLIAWIYLREAFALPERLCLSERGAARICDDLAAAAIAVGAPLLVDGQEFQVKCLQGLDGLTEHFSKFEYPVLANAELAEAVAVQAPAWADKVFFVEGYSHDLISQITPDSLAAGSGLVNPDVLVFALGVGAAHSFWAYTRGHITGPQAVHQMILDGTVRVGLTVAGGFAGKAVGLLVFGPAGALVLGTALPVLCQAQTKRVIDTVVPRVMSDYKQWAKEASGSVETLVRRLEAALEAKTAILRTKYRSLGCGVLGRYVKARIEDDARFLRESKVRLERAMATPDCPEGGAHGVIAWTGSSTVHPALVPTEMKALFEVLGRRPSITAPIGGWATAVWHAMVRGISATGSVLSLASGTPQDRRGN